MNNQVNTLETPDVNNNVTSQQPQGNQFTQQQKPKENVFEFDVEPLPFESNISSSLMSIYKLSKIVNSLLTGVLSGYLGCTLTPNTLTGTVDTAIYLEDKAENGKVHSIQRIGAFANNNGAQSKNALINRVNSFNALQKSTKAYMLTEDAKGVLKPFLPQVPVGPRQTKVLWERHEVEISEQNPTSNNFSDYKVMTKIKDLNINALLEKIYGSENGKYVYQVRLNAPLRNGKYEYLVTIDRLDVQKVRELAAEVAPATTQYGIKMVRGI